MYVYEFRMFFFCITIFILNPIKDKTKQTFYLALFFKFGDFWRFLRVNLASEAEKKLVTQAATLI